MKAEGVQLVDYRMGVGRPPFSRWLKRIVDADAVFSRIGKCPARHWKVTMSSVVRELRRPVIAIVAAALVTALTAVGVSAQWPTSCVELNNVVETHLGNVDNIGIYQRTFGNGAEEACRNDHGDDVRSTFGWAIRAAGPRGADGTSDPGADAEQACRYDHRADVRSTFSWAVSARAPSDAHGTSESTFEADTSPWPKTCIELNDIVEAHLGNHENVGIYQRAFGDDAEGVCRENISATSRWTVLGELPWVADGVVGDEAVALAIWQGIADSNWELAAQMACWTWFAEPSDSFAFQSTEGGTLRDIADIAQATPALVEPVSGFFWLADDLTYSEYYAVGVLNRLADYDVELAVRTAGLPWVRDGIRFNEPNALSDLLALVLNDLPRLARQVVDLNVGVPVASRNLYLPRALGGLHGYDRQFQTDRLERVTNQPWFTDGLDAEEVAFLTVVEAMSDPGLFNEWLASRSTQHATVTLPLAGPVNLWAFEVQSFPAGDNLLVMMEQGIRGAERLMGAPFPTNDVIALVLNDSKHFGHRPGSFGHTYIGLVRTEKAIDKHVVYHEIAHYFLTDRIGPHWLVEGGANFAVAYTLDLFGQRSLGESKRVYAEGVKRECTEHGIRNIHQIHFHQLRGVTEAQQGYRCGYPIGAHFLIRLFETLGKEPVSAALRELYSRRDDIYADGADEALVYRVFLKHTPPGLEEQFRDLYRRLHGGPHADAGA